MARDNEMQRPTPGATPNKLVPAASLKSKREADEDQPERKRAKRAGGGGGATESDSGCDFSNWDVGDGYDHSLQHVP